jgi:hypothetical protein
MEEGNEGEWESGRKGDIKRGRSRIVKLRGEKRKLINIEE